MNEISSNPILEFNPNQMAEVRKVFNYGDINRLQQDLNMFADWIKMQQHYLVKEYDKEYLERCLINSKGSIERAKKLFDKICTLRSLMPEYLQGFDIENEFQDIFKILHVCVLPKPTLNNHRIIYYNIHNPDATLYDLREIHRNLLMVFHYLNCHDYNAGIEFITDTRNFTLGMISKTNPIALTTINTILVEAFGLRIRGIHFISGSKFIDTLMTMVKQALPKKLVSRIHIHEDYESLFKVLPKDLLPKDIGGELDTSDKIAEKNFKEYSSPGFIKQMKFLESAAVDESKRLCSKFNEEYSGMPGSFKVLTVD